MLVYFRQRDESIMIGDDVLVTVIDIRGDKVRLGINAPKETSVILKEVYDAIKNERSRAIQAMEMQFALKSPIDLPADRLQRLGLKVGDVTIRPAVEEDMPYVNEIYNHYVATSTCTYQEEPEPLDERRKWFAKHGANHPMIVAEMTGTVIGWGSLSPYHARSAYRNTVENSVYVHHHFQRRGIGSAILKDLIARARTLGHRSIIGAIDAEQTGSIALHTKFGFEQVGHMKQAGFKFNRWLDVIYMQLLLT